MWKASITALFHQHHAGLLPWWEQHCQRGQSWGWPQFPSSNIQLLLQGKDPLLFNNGWSTPNYSSAEEVSCWNAQKGCGWCWGVRCSGPCWRENFISPNANSQNRPSSPFLGSHAGTQLGERVFVCFSRYFGFELVHQLPGGAQVITGPDPVDGWCSPCVLVGVVGLGSMPG